VFAEVAAMCLCMGLRCICFCFLFFWSPCGRFRFRFRFFGCGFLAVGVYGGGGDYACAWRCGGFFCKFFLAVIPEAGLVFRV